MKKNYAFITLMFLIIIILSGTTLLQAKKTQLLKKELNLTKIELNSCNNFINTMPKQENKIIYKLTEKQNNDLENYKLIDKELIKIMPLIYYDETAHNGNFHNLQMNEIKFLKEFSNDFKNSFSEGGEFKYK
jgi:hypothetical protein